MRKHQKGGRVMFDGVNELVAADGSVHHGLAHLYSQRIAPTSDWSDTGRSEHFVQFYEADDFIVTSVAEYLIHGIESGETCIVAATGAHLNRIERAIEAFGTRLEPALRSGRYIPLDAEKTLAKFMVDDMPDAGRFAAVIGNLIEAAVERGAPIRAFGEMVGVLCARENYDAAIRLEDLWNDLRKKHPFSLFCAYPMAGIKDSSPAERMAGICSGHSRVIPSESYTSLTSADERLRAIAQLQQRGKQLEAEIAELESRIALKQKTAAKSRQKHGTGEFVPALST